MIENTGKWLILAGVTLILLGLILWLGGSKLGGLGNLPGDIRIEKPGFSFYFPLTTSLLFSLIISLIFWLIRKFF
jgi:hypothetical protein